MASELLLEMSAVRFVKLTGEDELMVMQYVFNTPYSY
jgi:hypothetical protein